MRPLFYDWKILLKLGKARVQSVNPQYVTQNMAATKSGKGKNRQWMFFLRDDLGTRSQECESQWYINWYQIISSQSGN